MQIYPPYLLHGVLVLLAVLGVVLHVQRVHPRATVQIEQHLDKFRLINQSINQPSDPIR